MMSTLSGPQVLAAVCVAICHTSGAASQGTCQGQAQIWHHVAADGPRGDIMQIATDVDVALDGCRMRAHTAALRPDISPLAGHGFDAADDYFAALVTVCSVTCSG